MGRGEGQGLVDPAAGVMQDGAEGPHRRLGPERGRHEGAAFVGGQIEAAAGGVVQLHGVDRDRSVPVHPPVGRAACRRLSH